MKKFLSIVLALLVFAGVAIAEGSVISGNISSGGIAAMDGEGSLWFGIENRLIRMKSDGSMEQLAEGDARYIQAAEDGVYYVLRSADPDAGVYDDACIDTLWHVGEDGLPVQIGPSLPVRWLEEYDPEKGCVKSSTHYLGYTDMTVYGDYIYYIGTDDVPGTYITNATAWIEGEDGLVKASYDGSAAVFRMKKDGSGLKKLISGLGNSVAHMAIANDRVAVASSYRNAVYAYDFTNFMLYSMNGKHIKTFKNNTPGRHAGLYKEEEEFTVIVQGIQTDGEKIYASLSDSEGDFASSRLVDVENVDQTILIEAHYVPAIVTPGGIYYVTADVADTFWEEGMDDTTALYHRAPDGTVTLLAYLPRKYINFQMQMVLLGDTVYLRSQNLYGAEDKGSHLLRVRTKDRTVDELTEIGFAVCPPCDPAFAALE